MLDYHWEQTQDREELLAAINAPPPPLVRDLDPNRKTLGDELFDFAANEMRRMDRVAHAKGPFFPRVHNGQRPGPVL